MRFRHLVPTQPVRVHSTLWSTVQHYWSTSQYFVGGRSLRIWDDHVWILHNDVSLYFRLFPCVDNLYFARFRTQLIIARGIAGMGGGGLTVAGSVIVSDSVPLKSRGLYQGFANLLFGLGGAVGAPLGGWIGDTVGWRAAFLIQTPVRGSFKLVLCLLLNFRNTLDPAFRTVSPLLESPGTRLFHCRCRHQHIRQATTYRLRWMRQSLVISRRDTCRHELQDHIWTRVDKSVCVGILACRCCDGCAIRECLILKYTKTRN